MAKCGIINERHSQKSGSKSIVLEQETIFQAPQTSFHSLLLGPEGHGAWVPYCGLGTQSQYEHLGSERESIPHIRKGILRGPGLLSSKTTQLFSHFQ